MGIYYYDLRDSASFIGSKKCAISFAQEFDSKFIVQFSQREFGVFRGESELMIMRKISDGALGYQYFEVDDSQNTAAECAKSSGLKSLINVCELTGVSTQTLNNWYNNKRKLFDTVIAGCKAIKNET